MPIQGRTDAYGDKPKIPQMRFEHGLVKLSANAATFPTSTLSFATNAVSTAAIANGWVVSGVNVGNTVGTIGFNEIAPYVVNVSTNTVTLSQAMAGNIASGGIITFSKLILDRPANTSNGLSVRFGANSFNANVYMVTPARIKNASPAIANATTHVGWNHVRHYTGYVSTISTGNAGKGYLPANSKTAFFTITANGAFGENTTAAVANVGYAVNSNGAIANTVTNIKGSGFIQTPTVTTGGINATALQYISTATVTLGGWLYANGTVLTVTGGTGGGANVVAFVNAAGAIVTAAVQASGGGWGSTAPTAAVPAGGTSNATVSVTMANGSNATIVTTMGGRANRIHVQTMVALSNAFALTSGSGGPDWPGV
jgi:hypothetical protein